MAKLLIKDLAPNALVEQEPFVAKDKTLSAFKNKPGKFLSLALADNSGEIKGRVWDHAEELAERYAPGDVIVVWGRVDEYQGQRQLVITDLRPAEPGTYDLADLTAAGPRSRADLLAWLDSILAQVSEPHLRQLLAVFFDEPAARDRFASAFGARNIHHSYPGGLLEHTLGVVQILLCVADLHSDVNRDLLITGGLLHDLGKLEELDGVLMADYTDQGRFVGHTVLTDRMVNEQIRQVDGFPPLLAQLLCHMLLSHHGEREWGAPVVPMTMEACALHYADNLDARVQGFGQVRRNAEGATGLWSEYNRTYQRAIYLGETAPAEPDPDPESAPPQDPPVPGQLPL